MFRVFRVFHWFHPYGDRMSPIVKSNVLMGFYFFPRGGSAQVARYLCRALAGGPWVPTLFAGSLGSFSAKSNAEGFFSGINCESLDYSPAHADWVRGDDPMESVVPMHASYETKSGVSDRCFFDLDDTAYDGQVASWTRFLARHTADAPAIVHLHHLTPIHQAIRDLWPTVPIITHLHGTELKMIDGLGPVPEPGRWEAQWVERMRCWAGDSDRIIVVSEYDAQLAATLLPVNPSRVVIIGGGTDTSVFCPQTIIAAHRAACWERWLVTDPRGWLPNGEEGSIRYVTDDLQGFTDAHGEPVPVVLFAGRFMRFKRIQLLIEAHHARQTAGNLESQRSVLVIAGGFPGEWEGEHPYDTVTRLGATNVFFTGWRGHEDLAEMLSCADIFAAPAVDEPFGLVYLEAMAAGLPPIATTTGGPAAFINTEPDCPTGWLVAPDDLDELTAALAEAISRPVERRERGRRASRFVGEHYSWTSSAAAFTQLYNDVVTERACRGSQRSGPEPEMLPTPAR